MAEVDQREIEAVARAMEPSAFETYDRGYTCRNAFDERAFVNAERTVKTARRKASLAISALDKVRAGKKG